MVRDQAHSSRHALPVVDHDAGFPIAPNHPADLTSDAGSARRVMDDAPGPHEVERALFERQLLRVGALDAGLEPFQLEAAARGLNGRVREVDRNQIGTGRCHELRMKPHATPNLEYPAATDSVERDHAIKGHVTRSEQPSAVEEGPIDGVEPLAREARSSQIRVPVIRHRVGRPPRAVTLQDSLEPKLERSFLSVSHRRRKLLAQRMRTLVTTEVWF